MNIPVKNQYIKYNANNNVSFAGSNPINPNKQVCNGLQVFHHHIYEFKKGLRNLVLTTEKSENREAIENRLKKENIAHIIHQIKEDKINVYFGQQSCIDVVKTFDARLNKLSAEQDFILGIMLGYDRLKQCDRYLKIKSNLRQGDLIG